MNNMSDLRRFLASESVPERMEADDALELLQELDEMESDGGPEELRIIVNYDHLIDHLSTDVSESDEPESSPAKKKRVKKRTKKKGAKEEKEEKKKCEFLEQGRKG